MIVDFTRKTTREGHNPYRTIRVYRSNGQTLDKRVYVPQYKTQDTLAIWK